MIQSLAGLKSMSATQKIAFILVVSAVIIGGAIALAVGSYHAKRAGRVETVATVASLAKACRFDVHGMGTAYTAAKAARESTNGWVECSVAEAARKASHAPLATFSEGYWLQLSYKTKTGATVHSSVASL